MKKRMPIIIFTILICIVNLLGVLYFLNDNKQSSLNIYSSLQSRELYKISLNLKDCESPEEFTQHIKQQKVASSQCWYIYDCENKQFIIFKDKANQFIDTSVKNAFTNFNKDYVSITTTDSNNRELLLTIKSISINNKPYLLGTSEYTSEIYSTSNNINFNIYILAESILITLLLIVFMINNFSNREKYEKRIKKIKNEFEDYKKRFIVDDMVVGQQTITKQSIYDENGEYTPYFLSTMIEKLEKSNIPYNVFTISELKYWLLEDNNVENVYKINIGNELLKILLIDGTDKQKALFAEFEIKE